MKKLFFLLLTVVYCLSGIASEPASSWVKTKEGKIECKKVTLNSESATITFDNGEKKSIPVNTIISYSIKGKVFDKMTLYVNGRRSDQVFMQLIKTGEEYNLYEYVQKDGTTSSFVYKGDELYTTLTDDNRRGFDRYFNL